MLCMNMTAVFVANLYNPLTFVGIDTSVTSANSAVAAAAAAAAILQATATQAATTAVAATIAATLPIVFDSRNLPPDVRAWYDSFVNPFTIVTQSAMVLFTMPAGGCVPVLSYLDPPLGAGVKPSPTNCNRIITQNGQLFPLADQGNDGLKNFQNNISFCHGVTPKDV